MWFPRCTKKAPAKSALCPFKRAAQQSCCYPHFTGEDIEAQRDHLAREKNWARICSRPEFRIHSLEGLTT